MIVTCEERSAQAKAFEAVAAGPYDTLFYPNVDSCLSVTYVLEGNYLVGGHIGWGENMDPHTNGLRVKGKMDQLVTAAGREITKVVFVGDLPSYSLTQLIPVGVAAEKVYKIDNPKGLANIWFFSSRRWLAIESSKNKAQLYYGSIDMLLPKITL